MVRVAKTDGGGKKGKDLLLVASMLLGVDRSLQVPS